MCLCVHMHSGLCVYVCVLRAVCVHAQGCVCTQGGGSVTESMSSYYGRVGPAELSDPCGLPAVTPTILR